MAAAEIATDEGGSIAVACDAYRLVLSAADGFAGRNLYIPGASRVNLTRFDNMGAGPHPTCMYFDNLNVNGEFQQAFGERENRGVTADTGGAEVILEGHLVANRDGARGGVLFRKEMSFDAAGYEVAVSLDLRGVPEVDYVSVFWDVNDRWVRWMRDSSGAFLPLTVGVGDSFGDGLRRSLHPFSEMGRTPSGAPREVFMEVGGDSEAVRITLLSPEAGSDELKWGGMKFWDGPDDADEGPGVSHACPNLDIITTDWLGADGFEKPDRAEFSYRVDLVPAVRYRWV